MPKRPLPVTVHALFFAVLLLTGACSTPHGPEGRLHGEALPPVSLAGESHFFGEKLFVVATLRNTERPRLERPPGAPEGRRRSGGGGGGQSGDGPGGGGPRRMMADDPDQPVGMRMRAARGPTLTLKLTLNNTSNEPLTVVIRDVKSELGNFAARPERVTLAPQESIELDPMFPLADSVVGNIPLTLALRSAEQTESQTVMLRPTATPAPSSH